MGNFSGIGTGGVERIKPRGGRDGTGSDAVARELPDRVDFRGVFVVDEVEGFAIERAFFVGPQRRVEEAELLEIANSSEVDPAAPGITLGLQDIVFLKRQRRGPFRFKEKLGLAVDPERVIGAAMSLAFFFEDFGEIVRHAGFVADIPAEGFEKRSDELRAGLRFIVLRRKIVSRSASYFRTSASSARAKVSLLAWGIGRDYM